MIRFQAVASGHKSNHHNHHRHGAGTQLDAASAESLFFPVPQSQAPKPGATGWGVQPRGLSGFDPLLPGRRMGYAEHWNGPIRPIRLR